ncbi:hypothetical protein [Cronobacter phage EspYZU12]|nr:hypothetical protein EspYZU14_198 [Cronobacter phage EspYZU14]WBF78386.1 hypothetical protein [Cronobacter phage EspYZU12]
MRKIFFDSEKKYVFDFEKPIEYPELDRKIFSAIKKKYDFEIENLIEYLKFYSQYFGDKFYGYLICLSKCDNDLCMQFIHLNSRFRHTCVVKLEILIHKILDLQDRPKTISKSFSFSKPF